MCGTVNKVLRGKTVGKQVIVFANLLENTTKIACQYNEDEKKIFIKTGSIPLRTREEIRYDLHLVTRTVVTNLLQSHSYSI